MIQSDRSTQVGRSPFGELLVRFRTGKGLTQQGLALRVSGARLSARSITSYERSAANELEWVLPHRPTIAVIATALALTPSQQQQLGEAWEESQARKEASERGTESGAFVLSGREHLLEQLQRHWSKACSGTPQIVLLAAEAGMGKTRMATYFCDWVAANHEPAMVSWGESTSHGSTAEPYVAVRAATNRLLVPPMEGFTIPGAYSNRPELPTERVREILTYLPRLSRALVSDRTIINLGQRHPDIPADVFEGILDQNPGTESVARWDEYGRLLFSLSQEWPILMVLEDLHWAGDLTAALLVRLHHSLVRATHMPLMILGTLRSDEIEIQPDGSPGALAQFIHVVEECSSASYISMADTLTPTNGKAFIRGLLESFPMASPQNEDLLVDSLYTHTSGQPLLTTEMLRHLTESGALTSPSSASTWNFDPTAIKGDIPSAVSSYIEQRLGQVSKRGRALLEACAIMGETVLPELASQTLGLDDDQTIEFIDSVLVGKHHLLVPTGYVQIGRRYRSYRFAHALVREYIYEAIPFARKRSLHSKAAETLESLGNEFELPTMGAIANHYVQAEDWYGAEMAAYRAAQISVSRLDWDLAEFWFHRAEDLAVKAGDPRQLWRARAARLSMLRGLRRYDEALALGSRILRQVTYQDWPTVEALALHHLGEINYDLGNLQLAIEQITQAKALHLQADHIDLAAAASAMLSHSTYRLGQFDVAKDNAIQALELASQLENSWVRSEGLLAAANCELDLGFYEEALENYQAAIDLARTIGKLNNEFLPLMNMGLCLTFMGQHREAVDHLSNVIEIIESHASIRHSGTPFFYLGLAHEALEEYSEAQQAYQRSNEIRTTQPPTPSQFESIAGLMRVAIATDDRAETLTLLQTAEDHIREHTWHGMEYPLLVLMSLADAHHYLGNEVRYAELIREAHSELMQRASLLSDPRATDSYLNRDNINVEVQKRFAELDQR